MYKITEAKYEPENFFAGSFPIAKDTGKVKNNAKIRRLAPLCQDEDGIEEAGENTLDNLIGIAAAEPSGEEVVYYLTGEFFAQAIALPEGVTTEVLKPAFRKLGIFLKELNQNG